jgi:transcriptional regulator
MYDKPEFEPTHLVEAFDLVEAVRLGTLVTPGSGGLVASHLTFLLERDRGPRGTLVSHLAAANGHARLVEAGTPSLVVFQGPHGYVSSSWYPERDSAPTWNYAVVHAHGRPVALDRKATARHIAGLVEVLERGRERAWRLREVGHRFNGMLERVLGFEIEVERLEAKFKMGQDERPGDTRAAIEHLEREGRHDLANTMRERNPGHGTAPGG